MHPDAAMERVMHDLEFEDVQADLRPIGTGVYELTGPDIGEETAYAVVMGALGGHTAAGFVVEQCADRMTVMIK